MCYYCVAQAGLELGNTTSTSPGTSIVDVCHELRRSLYLYDKERVALSSLRTGRRVVLLNTKLK